MGKVISASQLRTELAQLLDSLDGGETHFIIKRNNQASAVLLSIEKFRDIMQTLETLHALEYIGQSEHSQDNAPSLFQSLLMRESQPIPGDFIASELEEDSDEEDSPSLVPLPGNPDKERQSKTVRTESLEEAAAKLGIRLIK